MRIIVRYFFRGLRVLLAPVMLVSEKLSTPRSVEPPSFTTVRESGNARPAVAWRGGRRSAMLPRDHDAEGEMTVYRPGALMPHRG